MSYHRTIAISAAVLLQTQGAYAETIDQDFERCVTTALEQRGQTAKAIVVDNGGFSQDDLDHDTSPRSTRYRMQVNSKSSGEDLGTVTCTISYSGDVLKATFDS
ncbi:MAG: hypothetical protein HKN50_13050 [Gammaproteobacteria bacterium]|nr:hypothetical protein [Gammaproteobacteria bacterium]